MTASYADMVVLGWLQFYRRVDEERLFKRVLKLEPALDRLYEAGETVVEAGRSLMLAYGTAPSILLDASSLEC